MIGKRTFVFLNVNDGQIHVYPKETKNLKNAILKKFKVSRDERMAIKFLKEFKAKPKCLYR